MVFLCRYVGFFLREGTFTAWRGRNFSHAMRLEGCKEFLLLVAVKSVIFCQNSTNLTYTPQILHFCILQMRTCFRSAIEASFIALT